jgi:hypothetical protein
MATAPAAAARLLREEAGAGSSRARLPVSGLKLEPMVLDLGGLELGPMLLDLNAGSPRAARPRPPQAPGASASL